jgi:hypothetical protein
MNYISKKCHIFSETNFYGSKKKDHSCQILQKQKLQNVFYVVQISETIISENMPYINHVDNETYTFTVHKIGSM